jgi:hypothetical protein
MWLSQKANFTSDTLKSAEVMSESREGSEG